MYLQLQVGQAGQQRQAAGNPAAEGVAVQVHLHQLGRFPGARDGAREPVQAQVQDLQRLQARQTCMQWLVSKLPLQLQLSNICMQILLSRGLLQSSMHECSELSARLVSPSDQYRHLIMLHGTRSRPEGMLPESLFSSALKVCSCFRKP